MEEAIRFHAHALKLKPKDPVLRYNLGYCRFRAGMFDAAEKDFRDALEGAPDNPNIQHLVRNARAAERRLRGRLEPNAFAVEDEHRGVAARSG